MEFLFFFQVEWHVFLCPLRSHAPVTPSVTSYNSLHLFDSAGTNTGPCTEASVPSVPPWQPRPCWQECVYSPWPHFAKSGWVRAVCGNSCLESAQKNERDFFDYYLFVHLPLKLSYSLRLLLEWAASQGEARGNSTLCALIISLDICFCFKGRKLFFYKCLESENLQWFSFNLNICKHVPWLPTIPQFILTPHPFVTVSLGGYHCGVNTWPWPQIVLSRGCWVEMPLPGF